jgi:hypothetical protein
MGSLILAAQKQSLVRSCMAGDCSWGNHSHGYHEPEETIMKNREMLLDEIYETAIQNDMTYFG